MKKTTLLILAISTVIACLSQPIITSSNYFQLGQKYIRLNKFDIELNQFSPGPSGINVTWDFSTMNFQHPSVLEDTISAIEPYLTPFFDEENTNYNFSNFCLKIDTEPSSTTDNNYHYYSLYNDSLQFIGSWANNGSSEAWFYSFDDYRTDMIFPTTYLDAYVDPFESSYNDLSGSEWHYQSGSTSVSADGYGSLITPDQDTLDNILRIATTIQYTDSNSLFGISNHLNTYYTWYSSDIEGPILKIQLTGDEGSSITNTYYYKKIVPSVGIYENQLHGNFEIYPNPCSGSFSINSSPENINNYSISIYNSLGSRVFLQNDLYQNTSINTDLPSGMYILELRNTIGKISRQNLIIH